MIVKALLIFLLLFKLLRFNSRVLYIESILFLALSGIAITLGNKLLGEVNAILAFGSLFLGVVSDLMHDEKSS